MTQRAGDLALYARLTHQARPYWPHLAGLILLNVVAASLKLLTPLPLLIGVDCVLGQEPVPAVLAPLVGSDAGGTVLLAVAAGLLVVIALLAQLASLACSLLSASTGEKLVLGFRASLFRHAQRLSLSYHDSRGTSDATYRILYDAPTIQWIMVEGLIPLFTASLTLCTMLAITAWLHWQLALVALVVVPVLFALNQVFGQRLRRQSKAVKEIERRALSVVQEALGALRVVKAFGQEDREEERFVVESRQGVRARLRILAMSGGLSVLVGLTLALGTATVLFLGVRHVQAGALTLGELLLVMAYLAQVYGPLETVSKKIADLQGSLACAERVFAMLDEEPEVVQRPGARPLARAAGAVALRDVCFGYQPDRPVLRDVDLQVPRGGRVGIVGATGAGKTTLLSLLIRFYDPSAGQVLLDGVDLRDYDLADLRQQFAIVLQEPVLFPTTIAENIAYAAPGTSEEDIVAAAKAANAHDFIMALPQGYQTSVGERGMKLSGGERQRISLARAFLKDAPLLIMDEPTSSVDSRTESLILEALQRLMVGRTTFVIAHRLATLRDADQILVMDHGAIVERGRHEELLERDGLYAGLHRQQCAPGRREVLPASTW
jgi:ATP-binding cassette subfamily B protein